MKITQMIKQLGGNRAAIAKQAGISIQQLNNMVSKEQEVEILPDGSFVAVRSNAVRFGVVRPLNAK
jgi:hypothetical protein